MCRDMPCRKLRKKVLLIGYFLPHREPMGRVCPCHFLTPDAMPHLPTRRACTKGRKSNVLFISVLSDSFLVPLSATSGCIPPSLPGRFMPIDFNRTLTTVDRKKASRRSIWEQKYWGGFRTLPAVDSNTPTLWALLHSCQNRTGTCRSAKWKEARWYVEKTYKKQESKSNSRNEYGMIMLVGRLWWVVSGAGVVFE